MSGYFFILTEYVLVEGEGNMKAKNINTKNISIKASVLGVLCSALITMIMAIAVSTLMYNDKIQEDLLGTSVFLIQIISALTGCTCSILIGKGNRMIQSLITVGSYYFILVAVTALLLDGTFQGMLHGLSAVMLGAAVPLVVRLFLQKKNNSMKMPHFSR